MERPRKRTRQSSQPSTSANPNPDWYLLHARIMGIYDPVIWRQLSVPPDITVDQLHLLMVAAFGWSMTHTHMWSIRRIQEIDPEEREGPMRSDLNPEGYYLPQMLVAEQVDHPRPDLPPGEVFVPGDHGLPPTQTLAELDAIYDISGNKHVLYYEYDMGDGWEHMITVEKRIKPTPVVTGGSGHSVAEDAGGIVGWDFLKEAYRTKNTQRDEEEMVEKREWYESMCTNGDPRGLKGKARLEHFNVKEANEAYATWKKVGT